MTLFRPFLTILFISLSLLLPHASVADVGFFTNDDTETILSPDEAFQLKLVEDADDQVSAQFTIAPGHYLYKSRIKFLIEDSSTGTVTDIELPDGEMKEDPNFGTQAVYHHDFLARFTIKNANKPTVKAIYQGCSEQGLCYAPQTKTFALGGTNPTASPSNQEATELEQDQATHLLQQGKLWLIAAGFFGFGLLLSLTPCVLPMIPILSGIIVRDEKAHHHETSRLHSFNLSLAYVLGIALSYTLAGIAAGLSGHLLSNALQSPTMLTVTALIFVMLAFSMFGFYELKMPRFVEERMVNTSNKLKGGQFMGVFLMGVISALIVSPCVAAPLAGTLIYISQTKDVVLGGVALFALSIGMGVPLLLIGASAGHVLPKAGDWMHAVRNGFGVLMLAVAIYIVSPIIPMSLQLLLWGALLIIPAIYLHALDSLPIDSNTGRSHPWMRFWKGIGVMMLLLGVMMLIGAVTGAKTPLNPLARFSLSNNQTVEATKLPFKRVQSINALDKAMTAAKGKIIMLDFYADWCVSCKEMESFTFSNSAVQAALKDVVLLQADVTDNNADDQALLARFGLYGPPGIIFFNAQGEEIAPKIIGYQNAEQFLTILNKVK